MPVWINWLLTAPILLLTIYFGLLLFDLKRPFYKLILIAMIAAATNNALEFVFGVFSPIKIIVPIIVLFCLYSYLAKVNILKSALSIIMGGNILFFIDSITTLIFYNIIKILPMEVINDSLLSAIGVLIMVSLGLGVIALIKKYDLNLHSLSELANNRSKVYKITLILLMCMPSFVYCFIVFLMGYTQSIPIDNILIILNLAIALYMAYFFSFFTLLKRTEQEREEKYRAVVENTNAIIIRLDPQGIIRFANRRALDFFGYTEEEFIGKPALGTFVPEGETTGRDLKEIVKEILANPARFNSSAYEGICRSGRRVWMEWTNSGIYDGKGYLKEFLAVGIDATDFKRAEEALKESEKQARQLVRRLENEDRNKNEFISILSHELRNPLATLSFGIELLGKSDSQMKQEKAIESMKRQRDHLIKLVDDLLDVSRISQNKIKLKEENINLIEITRKVIEDFRPKFQLRDVQLHTRIQRSEIIINADTIRISQVIGNVLENALKFAEKDGVVWLSLKKQRQNAVITVKDNGIGISPEIIPYLFEAFSQAEQTLDRQNRGLGLGLSIAKGIVDLHGGNIFASSPGLGMGSEFIIKLPIQPSIRG
jgi:PAS domain S-box-containing protein